MEENSRIIVIPDIHGRGFWKGAVRGHEADRIVFLGDYVDPYTYKGADQGEGIQALESVIEFKKEHPENVTLLLGNHDLGYLDRRICECRMDYMNEGAIRRLLIQNLSLFDIVHVCEKNGNRYLFSHAGITRGWVEQQGERLSETRENPEILNEMFHDASRRPILLGMLSDVSYIRGGDMDWGSPVWADSDELLSGNNNIPGFAQIFGHTQGNGPKQRADNMAVCLDCRRGFILETSSGRIDVQKDWKPSYDWMKDKLGEYEAPLLDDMKRTIRWIAMPRQGPNQPSEETRIRESVLGTAWGYLLTECESIIITPHLLTIKQMEEACVKVGLKFNYLKNMLMIHLANHDYGFFPDDENDADGGPCDSSGYSPGEMRVKLPSEVFVVFMKAYDLLVPDILKFIDQHIQEVRVDNNAEDIMLASVKAALHPYLKDKPADYDIELECDRMGSESPFVELTIVALPYYDPSVKITLNLQDYMDTPGKWLNLGYEIMKKPELAKEYDYVEYIEEIR